MRAAHRRSKTAGRYTFSVEVIDYTSRKSTFSIKAVRTEPLVHIDHRKQASWYTIKAWSWLMRLQQAVELSTSDHTEPAGSITVAAPEAFLNSVLQPFVVPFLNQYPEIQLKLKSRRWRHRHIAPSILRFALPTNLTRSLVLKELGKTNLVLCTGPKELLGARNPCHHIWLFWAHLTPTLQKRWSLFGTSLKMMSFARYPVSGRYMWTTLRCDWKVLKRAWRGAFSMTSWFKMHWLKVHHSASTWKDWTIKSNYHGASSRCSFAQTKYIPARLRVFVITRWRHLRWQTGRKKINWCWKEYTTPPLFAQTRSL